MRLGVLNIFWFGVTEAAKPGLHFYHQAPEDDRRVRDLIAFAGVDVIALIEIVDVMRLEQMLATLPGAWRVRDANGNAIASAPPAHGDHLQRVVLAFDNDRVELVRWSLPIAAGPRPPMVARFRDRATGLELTTVAVHPKSGDPFWWQHPGTPEDGYAATRAILFTAVAQWLSQPPPEFAGQLVLLGDFNSVRDAPECSALRALAGWTWSEPTFVPADVEPRTTRTDLAIIDHVLLSPELIGNDHEVLAFDAMDAFPEGAPISTVVWKRTTDHRFVRIAVQRTAP